VLRDRAYSRELRSFAVAPYMRALYERLSNERLKELAANLRKRARYSILSTGASSVVTALTYGALAYLVIERRIGVAEAGAAVAASQQLSGQLSSVVGNMTQLYEASLFLEDWEEFSALAPAAALAGAARATGAAPAAALARPAPAALFGPESATPFERIQLDHV